MEVKFKGKRTKVGGSIYILIPAGIAKLLQDDKEYDIMIDEHKEVSQHDVSGNNQGTSL